MKFKMTFKIGKYKIELFDESAYNSDSHDNTHKYSKEYFIDTDFKFPTKIGIKVFENGFEFNSAIIGTEGGATGIHKNSQVFESNRVLICCCDSVFCLDLPTLNLHWNTKVDEATAFGIYKIENGFIIHGELAITRIDDDGKIIWQNTGADIFVSSNEVNELEVREDFVTAIDWNNRVYKWNLDGLKIT